MIFQLDLIRRARRDAQRQHTGFGAAMAAIRRDKTAGIIRAAEIMTPGLPTVARTTPVASLLPLLADGGAGSGHKSDRWHCHPDVSAIGIG